MWLRLLVLAGGSVVGAVLGMRAHEQARLATATPAALPSEPPVAAPADLATTAVLASPDATWRKLQTMVGGVFTLAPPTFGGVLGSFAKVPSLMTIVDGGAPAFGAADGSGRWVIAAHVVTTSQARSTLIESKMTLEPKTDGIELLHHEDVWVGLGGQYLLVGSSREAITSLGPYAYRTLPARKLPESALAATATAGALAGPARAEMLARIASTKRFLLDKDEEQRRAHGGRAPDLADPKPIVDAVESVASRYAMAITGMARADLALDIDDEGARAHVTLTPPAAGDARAFVDSFDGGGSLPLGASSADSVVTFFWLSGKPEREHAASDFAQLMTSALGTRIPAEDEAKVAASLARIAQARAGWAALSVSGGAMLGALLRLPTNDASAITQAIDGDVALAMRPTWAKWEDDASVKKIERTPGGAAITTDQGTVQAKWVAHEGEVDVAVGLDASALLAPPARTLQNDAKVAAWLHDLRGDVSWALVARPLLLESSPRSDAACVALVRRGGAIAFDVRATSLLVRKLVLSSKVL